MKTINVINAALRFFITATVLFFVLFISSLFASDYVVQKGDTAYKIAQRANISIPLLEMLNGRSLQSLKVGEKVIIPPRGIDQNFLTAVAGMESNGIPESRRNSVVGDHGNAIGRYQLWTVYVDDANAWRRQHGLPTFSYTDRSNRLKSEAIVITYMLRYHKTLPVTDALRLHNGGPNWRRMPKTIAYANKAMVKFWPRGNK